jgi:hypothetical protein
MALLMPGAAHTAGGLTIMLLLLQSRAAASSRAAEAATAEREQLERKVVRLERSKEAEAEGGALCNELIPHLQVHVLVLQCVRWQLKASTAALATICIPSSVMNAKEVTLAQELQPCKHCSMIQDHSHSCTTSRRNFLCGSNPEFVSSTSLQGV